MTEKGRRVFEEGMRNVGQTFSSRKEQMEAWRIELMQRMDSQTLDLFLNLPPSLQRQNAGWVMSGKMEETRKARLEELGTTLAKGERLGLK